MRLGKLLLLIFASNLCVAQADRIAGPINSNQKVVLPGNVHPLAKPLYDQGPVEPALAFPYVTLVAAPSASQQAALNLYLAQLQERSSPNYHKWLTPEQYADRFGLSQADINKIGIWLQSQGFTVLKSARGRNAVMFSGTAAQIQSAFNTEIHRYSVNGESHVANATPIQIPAALGGIVTSIRGLNNFRFKPMYVRAHPGPHPRYTTSIDGEPDYFLAPGDIATIYDIYPLYNATTPIDGTGQQLAIIGQTDVYLADINDFRSGFGFSTIPTTGSSVCTTNSSGIIVEPCNTPNFEYILVGTDEGVSPFGDIEEADLDLEWSGATARNAQIIFVNSPVNTTCTDCGVDVSLQYAIDNVVAPVVSMSYGLCESLTEPAGISSMETELQQANTEGMTIMNSAGDTGSFACDNAPPNNEENPPFSAAVGGIAVNYPASSAEVTGVGGTSIPAFPTDEYTDAYWSGTNTIDGGSATTALIGTEAAWNDDAAFALFCQGDSTNSFCENGGPPAVPGWVALGKAATAQQVQQDIWISQGSGGVSNCTTQNSGICTGGFARPSWQTVSISGVPSGRLVPDVSLLASPDYPGYIICTPMNALTGSGTDTSSSCASGIQTAVDTNFSLVGGTSASSPIFAGMITLINQYLGSAGLGNINPTLYSLATANSTNKAFHQITSGENDVYCAVGDPTGQPSGVVCPSAGVGGFSDSQVSTTAPTIYNPVNGLGSVDVNALATAWNSARSGTSSVAISTTASSTVFEGVSVSFTATVTPTPASSLVGAVSFSTLNGTTTTVLGNAMLNTPYPTTAGTTTFTTDTLPVGTNVVSATYLGDASTPPSPPSPAPATVTVIVPYTMSASPSSLTASAGQSAATTITITPTSGFTGAVTLTCSAGLPAGASCNFSSAGPVTLNGSTASTVVLTISTLPNMALPSGAQTVTITGTSGGAAITTTVSLTVTATTESYTLSTTASTFPVNVGGTASVVVTVNGKNGFVNTSNNTTVVPLTYTCSGIPSTAEIACQVSNNGQPTNANTVTVKLVTTPVTSKLEHPFGRNPIFYAVLLPGLFGIAFVRPRMRNLRLLGLMMVLGLSTLWLGACGGGNKSSGTGPSSLQNGGTPPGNYSVTINATTGGAVPLTNTLTVTLAVSAQ
jgi:Pro-kumamolisin, activation domain